MKALIYFILFYASIFLISMIPEDKFAYLNDGDQVEETIDNPSNNKETSYTNFSDSAKGQWNAKVYTK